MTDSADPSSRTSKRKLIEVSIPLEDINRESVREKSIRRGHPSTMHLWWARRPLAACRAVLFAQLVDDPSEHRELFPSEAEQAVERKRLHGIISELVRWENIHNQRLLTEARTEIRKSCGGDPPPILDPFAGGGSIPLEALRLDLDAYASDLNPVAVLITKALIEFPPRWAGHTPAFPGVAESAQSWPDATGLAEDVRRYGKWMHDEAKERIGRLYPMAKIGGVDATVIAWLWARAVTCPNPACGGSMPLVRSFWLAKKAGRERYVEPISEEGRIRFEIGGPDGCPRDGTMSRTGATCLLCNTPVRLSYISAEGKAGRIGVQLMAIAAESGRQRYYLPADPEHAEAVNIHRPANVPEEELAIDPRNLWCVNYGLTRFADLFTNRQLTALKAFSDLVGEARDRILSDGAEKAYADAVATYLGLSVSRMADIGNALCRWENTKTQVRNLFTRQAIPMLWDFAETQPFSDAAGGFLISLGNLARTIDAFALRRPATVTQADAAKVDARDKLVVATDPPYYDNVAYANLSDFFYVWLRRSLGGLYPELMRTIVTPKEDEMVADPYRHGGKEQAKLFFEERFEAVFSRISRGTPKGYPISFFYAYKQAETDNDGNYASTGWETLLDAMLKTGWTVTATWPIRTELATRPRNKASNALASSIVLVCRPRPEGAETTDRRGLIAALNEEMPDALRKLEEGGVAPVDLRQAAIGPGMAIFSRYERVNEPDGEKMRVRAALALINRVLDEWLSQLEGDVTADTRWCVEWYKEHGFDPGPFGDAETLSKGTDTGVLVLDRAGVLRARGGKVKLLPATELPEDYNPAQDNRISEWKVCLHLAKRLKEQGADPAAQLMAATRDVIDVSAVKELAYLLYSIADKKGWQETALLFNGLGTSWFELDARSRGPGAAGSAYVQDRFDAGAQV